MRAMFIKSAALCLSFLAMTFSAARAQDQLYFDQAGTELSGRMLGSFVMVGSGQMLEGQILHLEAPVTITGNKASEDRRNRRTVKGVDKVLLKFEDGPPSDDIMGGKVLVSGRLINKPSDPFHTAVTMIVAELTLIAAPSDDEPVATFKTH